MSLFQSKVMKLKEQMLTNKQIAERLSVDEARVVQALKRLERRERGRNNGNVIRNS